MRKFGIDNKRIDSFRYQNFLCGSCIIKSFYNKLTAEEREETLKKVNAYFSVKGCAGYCLGFFAVLDDDFIINNYTKINNYLKEYDDKTECIYFHLICHDLSNSETEGTCANFFYFLYDIYTSKNDSKNVLLDIE